MMKSNYSIVPKVLQKNPKMAKEIIEAFVGMNKAKIIDYIFGNGNSKTLSLITFKITPLCNLRCAMCGQNGLTGTLKDHMGEEVKKLVPLQRYKDLVDEVAGKAKIFYIWGGEPFLYPDFMDFAEYAAKKVVFTVNTNGTFLKENAERIVRDKWGAIFISLDSFEDVNDKIRGKGTYKRVMEGIEALNEQKKLQNSSLPYVGIVTAVSNMNYEYLDKFEEALAGKGLSWHIINLGTYTNQEIGKQHQACLQEKLGITPTYWAGFANGYNEGIDGAKFAKILENVHKVHNEYPVITVPVIDPEKIGIYHSELEVPVRDKCYAPWFSVDINYDGDVHFCADYPDWILGNIKDEPILKIFSNEKARKFRKALKSSPNGIFPACKRCYQLMLLGHRCKGF